MKLIDVKYAAEIRFRPNLKYYDGMFKIASDIESDYEDWGATHNPSMAQLVNKDKQKRLTIAADSISILTENKDMLKDFDNELSKIFQLFIEPAEISEIRRVGIRKMAIYELDSSYDELVEKFYSIFYPNNTELSALAADKVSDVAFTLEGIKDGLKDGIRLGPLRPNQKEAYFQPEFSKEKLDSKKSHIFIDVDVFNDLPDNATAYAKLIPNIFALNKSIFKGFHDLAESGLEKI